MYAARASKLILVDRDAAALSRAAARCESEGLRGVEVQCLTVDVTNFPAVQSMMSQALDRFKRLDVLVLCAGLGGHHLFDATTDLAIFHKLMDVNFFVSLFRRRCCRRAHWISACVQGFSRDAMGSRVLQLTRPLCCLSWPNAAPSRRFLRAICTVFAPPTSPCARAKVA